MKVLVAAFIVVAAVQAVNVTQINGHGIPIETESINSDKHHEYGSRTSFAGADQRIVSGNSASRGQFPWHVAVYLDGSAVCGSSLISDKYLLTAAHCASGVRTFTAILGSTNLQSTEQGRIVITTTTKIVHSSYNSNTLSNDIALIYLSQTVTSSTYVRPIRLPKSSTGIPIGSSLIACGYRSSSSSSVGSSGLKYSTQTVISNADCKEFYPQLLSSNFCAVSPSGSNPCVGDSGGSVVLKEEDGQYTQVGIVAFLSSRCQSVYPSVFTRVSIYSSWISANTGITI